MKERPILFSAPMVLALLAGAKTQTRRKWKRRAPEPYEVMSEKEDGSPWPYCEYPETMCNYEPVDCPYGVPGDRLWVRETWGPADKFYGEDASPPAKVAYRADKAARAFDWTGDQWIPQADRDTWNWGAIKWKPSIFMPRWASRLTLEVTDIHVERLQSITEVDAFAEGMPLQINPIGAYEKLWREINGDASWAANPWVWVVSFKRVEAERELGTVKS